MFINKYVAGAAMIVVALLAGMAAAQTGEWDCGAVEGTVTCTLDEDGTFTVSGSGAMRDYSSTLYVQRDDSPWYDIRSAVKSVIIEEGVTSVGWAAFWNSPNLTSVAISNSVTHIGGGAFGDCSGLTSITIPDGVTVIDSMVFSGCVGLTSVTIGDGVITIGWSAFFGCTGLTSIDIPNSVTTIESGAFSGCSGLESLTIGENVEIIGGSAFSGCTGLTSITIPNSVTVIEDFAFFGCTNLTSVSIGNGVSIIDMSKIFFQSTGLTYLSIGNGLTSFGSFYPFEYPDLMSIEVAPNNADYSSVDGVLFNKAQDTLIVYPIGKQEAHYTIPDGVISVEWSAFGECRNLVSVIIPGSVASIGARAFYNCTGLTSVISMNQAPPQISIGINGTFDGVDKSGVCLYVPEESVEDYRMASGWSDFSCINGIGEYVSTLTRDLNISQVISDKDAAVIIPVNTLLTEFTAGPNPVSRSDGVVKFYRQGARINNASLTIYDATGNVIRKTNIRDNGADALRATPSAMISDGRRIVGEWDLRDSKARAVAEGTYLVRSVVRTVDGKRERVSVVLVIR